MGQQGSRSSMEAVRVVFQRGDTESPSDTDESSSPSSVRIQKRVDRKADSPSFSSRAHSPEKCWSHCRGEPEGLEYVMDNPTGGVWVKSKDRWTRS